MMYLYSVLFLFVVSLQNPAETGHVIGPGRHPAAAVDPAGALHVVFGQGAILYYTTSVDSLPGLHLGASRGPQVAATTRSVVITAIDKLGNVWGYSMDRKTGRWKKQVPVTDQPEMAKEGFVALTAGPADSYTAIWLDLRGNQRNKLMSAHSTDGGLTWQANRLVYESPAGTICECCQPSIVSQGQSVAVMFRNYVAGARDMYLIRSANGGQTFGAAEKLGEGTWKLNACPMDGGGVYMAPDGAIATVWRREDKLFAARPNQAERELGTGRNAKIVSTATGDYVAFQREGRVWVIAPGQSEARVLGEGGFPKLVRLPNDQVLCLWEQAGSVLSAFI
jgi:hypothetical protein